MRDKKTRKLTLTAICAAGSVVLVFLASAMPTGQLGFTAIGSLFCAATVIEAGLAYGAAQFVVAAGLTLLLVPDKGVALLYALFFGYYPLVKSLAEQVKSQALGWIIKLAVLNAAFTALVLILGRGIVPDAMEKLPLAVLYIAANAVFVLYDIGVTKLIALYMDSISKFRKR